MYWLQWSKARNREFLPEDLELTREEGTTLFVPADEEGLILGKKGVLMMLGEREVPLPLLKEMVQREYGMAVRMVERLVMRLDKQGVLVCRTDPGDKRQKLVRKGGG